MENQMNVGNQNARQIGQNSGGQPVLAPEKPKTNYLMIGGIILACFMIFGFSGYYLGKQPSSSGQYMNDQQNQIASATPSIENNPTPTPASMVDPTANWKTYTFESVKLTFKAPPDLYVKGEEQKNSDTGVPYSFTLYIQNYDETHPLPSGQKFYQLYGLYQWSSIYTQKDIDARKKDYVASSIKNVVIDSYFGIKGQYKGERNRYVTEFIKDGGLFTLFTADPFPENETLSDQIISTFRFTK